MEELNALESLAQALGVHTTYTDGLGNPVTVSPETLVRVCTALGAGVGTPEDAPEALRALHEDRSGPGLRSAAGALPPA